MDMSRIRFARMSMNGYGGRHVNAHRCIALSAYRNPAANWQPGLKTQYGEIAVTLP